VPLRAAKGLDCYFVQVFGGGDSFYRKKPDPRPGLAETC